jgi:hypothetical protein
MAFLVCSMFIVALSLFIWTAVQIKWIRRTGEASQQYNTHTHACADQTSQPDFNSIQLSYCSLVVVVVVVYKNNSFIYFCIAICVH